MPIYRDRIEPYGNLGNMELQAHFQTNPPSLWWKNENYQASFAEMYGFKALVKLLGSCCVPENTDPVFVGGTNWRVAGVYDDAGNLVHELPSPEPAPDPLPWNKPDRVGLSYGDKLILRGIELVYQKLCEVLAAVKAG